MLAGRCQVVTGELSTCYRKDAICRLSSCYWKDVNLLSERCYLQAVNLLCKLLSEDAFCKLSVVTGMLYAAGKDVVFRCWRKDVNLLSESCLPAVRKMRSVGYQVTTGKFYLQVIDLLSENASCKLSSCYWKDVNLKLSTCCQVVVGKMLPASCQLATGKIVPDSLLLVSSMPGAMVAVSTKLTASSFLSG